MRVTLDYNHDLGKMSSKLISILFTVLIGIQSSTAQSILILVAEGVSHVLYMSSVGAGCAQAGLNVTLALSTAYPNDEVKALEKQGMTIIRFKSKFQRPLYREPEQVRFYSEMHLTGRQREGDQSFVKHETELTWEMMDDVQFMQTVKESNFDMVIIDGYVLGMVRFILPHKLGLPYIVVTTMFSPWIHRIPALPSFVPLLKFPYTEKMTFFQRLENTKKFAEESIFSPQAGDSTWKRYLPGVKPPTVAEVLSKSEVSLYNIDILMGYPVPLMPNTIPVGGLTIFPPKSLHPELSSFLDSTDGVIVVTFGSVLPFLAESLSWKLYKAFELIKHQIIFRYDGPPQSFSSNVRVMKWIPQIDILAHPKVKVFLTHCGNNGQMEALQSGVPMVGVPVFLDQIHNAVRMEYLGYGRKFSLNDDTPEKLAELVHEVYNNQTYRDNIKRASAIYNSRPETPRQRAAFWIKHVIKFGSKHLRSYANDMPLYQYWMVDIIVFLFFISILAMLFTLVMLYFVTRGICVFVKRLRPPSKVKKN